MLVWCMSYLFIFSEQCWCDVWVIYLFSVNNVGVMYELFIYFQWTMLVWCMSYLFIFSEQCWCHVWVIYLFSVNNVGVMYELFIYFQWTMLVGCMSYLFIFSEQCWCDVWVSTTVLRCTNTGNRNIIVLTNDQ
jgi:hypothetical protein